MAKIDSIALEEALRRGARSYVYSMLNMTELAELVAKEDVSQEATSSMMAGEPAPTKEDIDSAVKITSRVYLKSTSFQIVAKLFEDHMVLDMERGRVYMPASEREIDVVEGLAECFREAMAVLEHDIVSKGEDYLLPLHTGLAVDREVGKGALESILGKKPPEAINIGAFRLDVSKPTRGARALTYEGDLSDVGTRTLADINTVIEQARIIKDHRLSFERKNNREQALTR